MKAVLRMRAKLRSWVRAWRGWRLEGRRVESIVLVGFAGEEGERVELRWGAPVSIRGG